MMSTIIHTVAYVFFFNDTATTEIYTLSLHDALPILPGGTSWSTLVVFHVAVQASQHRFLERLSFLRCLLLAPWSKMGCPCTLELGSGFSILLHGSVCLFLGPDCAVSVPDRKSTRLNSSHANISYAVFCLKKNTACTTDLLSHP